MSISHDDMDRRPTASDGGVLWPLDEQVIALESVPGELARVFEASGIKTWAEVSALSDVDLLLYSGISRVTLVWLRYELARRAKATRPGSGGLGKVPIYVTLPLGATPDRTGIYFIACGAFVKIGMAGSVRKRFRGLQQGIPFQLDLLGVIELQPGQNLQALERHWHQRFALYRQVGEWFRCEGELRDFCDRLATGESVL